MSEENNVREHTVEEIADGIEPNIIGIDGVAKAYDKYISKEELEK